MPESVKSNGFKSRQGTIDCPDLDFVYDDADKHPNETAELYSYTEGPEFQTNIRVCSKSALVLERRVNKVVFPSCTGL